MRPAAEAEAQLGRLSAQLAEQTARAAALEGQAAEAGAQLAAWQGKAAELEAAQRQRQALVERMFGGGGWPRQAELAATAAALEGQAAEVRRAGARTAARGGGAGCPGGMHGPAGAPRGRQQHSMHACYARPCNAGGHGGGHIWARRAEAAERGAGAAGGTECGLPAALLCCALALAAVPCVPPGRPAGPLPHAPVLPSSTHPVLAPCPSHPPSPQALRRTQMVGAVNMGRGIRFQAATGRRARGMPGRGFGNVAELAVFRRANDGVRQAAAEVAEVGGRGAAGGAGGRCACS